MSGFCLSWMLGIDQMKYYCMSVILIATNWNFCQGNKIVANSSVHKGENKWDLYFDYHQMIFNLQFEMTSLAWASHNTVITTYV